MTAQIVTPSQAVDIAQRFSGVIMAFFVIGYAAHVGLQVDAIARAPNNPATRRRLILYQNGLRLFARFFVSFCLFGGIWRNPEVAAKAIGLIGITPSETVTGILTLPMSPWVAGIFGFFMDSLLAYVPFLKNALPQINGTTIALTIPPGTQVGLEVGPTVKTHAPGGQL